MNEVRSYGPENQAWGRRYGIGDAAVGTMASDLFPVVDSTFRGMDDELLALQGGRARGSAVNTGTATVGELTALGIANPLGSGVIAVLERVRIIASSALSFSIRVQGAAVSASQSTVQGFARDSRLRTERLSLRVIATDEAAAGNYGDQIDFVTVVANELRDIDMGYVLAPLSTLWVVCTTANSTFSGVFLWRQRRIEDGETPPA